MALAETLNGAICILVEARSFQALVEQECFLDVFN
jgi:hypothetical protein